MFPRFLIIAAICSVLCLTSLGTEPAESTTLSGSEEQSNHINETRETSPDGTDTNQNDSAEEKEELEPTTEELLTQVDWSSFDLPVSTQEQVLFWIESFSSTRRWVFHRWMKRSWRYRLMIQRELNTAGLPTDLLYMAMIESQFDPAANSHAGAAGIWQFMPATATRFGLIVNDSVDERRDPYRSTLAAIEYLKLLHRKFPYWYLAIAAYNCGEGTVERAMQKHGTGDYYKLCEKEALPEETCDYVPRIIAAAIVDKNPGLFGVPGANQRDKALSTKLVIANRGAKVQQLADAAEMNLDEFQEYNPHLLTESIVIEKAEIQIYLPPARALRYSQNIRRLDQDRLSSGRSLDATEQPKRDIIDVSHHKKSFTHIVQEGETLTAISEQYGLSLSQVETWNPQTQTLSPGDKINVAQPRKRKMIQHTIKANETLRKLAKKYDCSVDDIMAWNNLSEPKIPAKGEKLYITTWSKSEQ